MKESDIEKKVCDYAESKGFVQYKFSSPGVRGVPDRMFVDNYSTIFFIEFKTPKGKAGPHQVREIKKLRDQGVSVYVIDSVNSGKKVIDSYVD